MPLDKQASTASYNRHTMLASLNQKIQSNQFEKEEIKKSLDEDQDVVDLKKFYKKAKSPQKLS